MDRAKANSAIAGMDSDPALVNLGDVTAGELHDGRVERLAVVWPHTTFAPAAVALASVAATSVTCLPEHGNSQAAR